jgi:uncharacterized small protein (DUF1192 family)
MSDTNALIDRLIRIKDGLTHRADRDAINEACAAFTDGSFYKESDIDAMQDKIAALEARVARLTVERNAADQNQWDIRSQAKIAALEAQIATLTKERDQFARLWNKNQDLLAQSKEVGFQFDEVKRLTAERDAARHHAHALAESLLCLMKAYYARNGTEHPSYQRAKSTLAALEKSE